jgi:hypothetical protein
VLSVTREATEAVDPAYAGVLVSMIFQGEGIRFCSGGRMELQVPVCARKQDLPLSAE